MTDHIQTQTTPIAPIAVAGTRLMPVLAAALLGMVILYGVGFANLPVAHNAAHDTRHSFAFPCH